MSGRPFDLLNDSIGNKILVNLRNGKEISGELKSFDQHMNLALSGATELENGERKQKIGEIVVRGDNIFYIST